MCWEGLVDVHGNPLWPPPVKTSDQPSKVYPKAAIDAKGPDGLKALEIIRRSEEQRLKKPLVWVLGEDDYYRLKTA